MDFEVSDIGGVKNIKFTLKKGVNVLRGPNGIGKTSTIHAVTRAQGGKVPIERRDGTDGGEVRGPGVMLTVRDVAKRSGVAEVSLVDVGPLAKMIEPGLKDSNAAARARVRALAQLLGISIEDRYLMILCSDDEEMVEWLKGALHSVAVDDLLMSSEVLKNHAHDLARKNESDAHEWGIEASVRGKEAAELLEQLGAPERWEENWGTKTIAEWREEWDLSVKEFTRAEIQCEDRKKFAARQGELKETIGPDPAPHLKEAQDLLVAANKKAEAADRKVVKCREALSKAESESYSMIERVDSAETNVARVRVEIREWQRQQEILDKPLEGPTTKEVELLAERRSDAAKGAAHAKGRQDYRDAAEDAGNAKTRADAASEEAKRLRKMAAALPAAIGEILKQAGAPGLTVIDGRLHATDRKTPRDYELRCSTGERIAFALDVVASVCKDKIVPLDGELWGALDPAHKAAFAKAASKRGLIILTEEPTSGELRVEQEVGD